MCSWKKNFYEIEKEEGCEGKIKYVIYCSEKDDFRI